MPVDEETRLVRRAASAKKYWDKNQPRHLWHVAKGRALKAGYEFTIGPEDIVIPEHCPVLGIKLEKGTKGFQASSPSVDKFHPALGYVPGNVDVISFRANRIKADASLSEIEALISWMEAQENRGSPKAAPV